MSTVTHIIVNNLGGITSLVKNLILYKGAEANPQELVVLNIVGNKNTPAHFSDLADTPVRYFSLNASHNWHHTYKAFADVVGKEPGVLVSNDLYDLIMVSRFNLPKKVVQIVHDGHNVRLSLQYEAVIDAFICHSRFFYEMLCQLLPHRRADITLLYYGIPLAATPRISRLHNQPLKLVFLGRHDSAKGIHDLHKINTLLQNVKVPVQWTILGRGPETAAVKAVWQDEANVEFITPAATEELYAVLATQDILVFPTKFEGFPVALVEAMSLGCVPVATDLPGGIREIISDSVGVRCAMDDNAAFAAAIATMHHDRSLLESRSRASAEAVLSNHNAEGQSVAYQQHFNKVAAAPGQPRHHNVQAKIGSRLDRSWIPNVLTKTLRRK